MNRSEPTTIISRVSFKRKGFCNTLEFKIDLFNLEEGVVLALLQSLNSNSGLSHCLGF